MVKTSLTKSDQNIMVLINLVSENTEHYKKYLKNYKTIKQVNRQIKTHNINFKVDKNFESRTTPGFLPHLIYTFILIKD